MDIPKYLSPNELADTLSVSIETLAQWRWLRIGPPFIRLGHGQRKLVRYPAPAVAHWLSQASQADSKPTQ